VLQKILSWNGEFRPRRGLLSCTCIYGLSNGCFSRCRSDYTVKVTPDLEDSEALGYEDFRTFVLGSGRTFLTAFHVVKSAYALGAQDIEYTKSNEKKELCIKKHHYLSLQQLCSDRGDNHAYCGDKISFASVTAPSMDPLKIGTIESPILDCVPLKEPNMTPSPFPDEKIRDSTPDPTLGIRSKGLISPVGLFLFSAAMATPVADKTQEGYV